MIVAGRRLRYACEWPSARPSDGFIVAPVARESAENLEGERIDGPFGVRLVVFEGLDRLS